MFNRYLGKLQIAPGKIKLIIITHVHFDHVGGLKAIKELCKCPVAIHEKEALLLEGGVLVLPPGTNLFSKAVAFGGGKLGTAGFLKFPPVKPESLYQQRPHLSHSESREESSLRQATHVAHYLCCCQAEKHLLAIWPQTICLSDWVPSYRPLWRTWKNFLKAGSNFYLLELKEYARLTVYPSRQNCSAENPDQCQRDRD